jgi:hypothetical protein
MVNHGECRCERCGFRGEPLRASRAAKAGLVALYLAAVAMMMCSALSGFLTVFLAPMIVAICAAIQAPLAEAATEPTRCPRCRCVLIEEASPVLEAPERHPVSA